MDALEPLFKAAANASGTLLQAIHSDNVAAARIVSGMVQI
jgi:hypothetical protein